MDEDDIFGWFVGFGVVIVIGLIMLFFVWGYPTLKPWWAEQDGKAELAQAEQNRQILITQAEAENVAATSKALTRIKLAEADAQAEVARAEGVAKANQIIGESLKGHNEYLKYLYITGITTKENKEVIYIPTEAGLPILEAGRLQ